MKFALLTVIFGGLFYKGEALSLEQQIYKTKEIGFDALAIETKRPVASPPDLTKADRNRIRKIAADEGIPLCAIESMSDFTGRHMEETENNLAMMRFVLELAKNLGVELVKIFAAWPGIINGEEPVAMYGQFERGNYYKRLFPSDLRQWNHCVEKAFAKWQIWPQIWALRLRCRILLRSALLCTGTGRGHTKAGRGDDPLKRGNHKFYR